MRDELIRAANIFNSKHRKYKCSIEENKIVLNYYDKSLESSVHVYIKFKESDRYDDMLKVIEDLRKDLTGVKK